MRRAASLAVLAVACAMPPFDAAALQLRGAMGAFSVPVTSLKQARFKTVVRQSRDFSCGSAALATLLTYHFDQPVSEDEVFERMYARGDRARIRREGFSMLDLRGYLRSRGLEADGFELPLDKLIEEGVPAIVLINERGYRHFVVVKGLLGGRVLVGDPAVGLRRMERGEFERAWGNGVLFVVHNRRELARFNDRRDWGIAPLGPLELAVQRSGLQTVVMPRRGPGDI